MLFRGRVADAEGEHTVNLGDGQFIKRGECVKI